MQTAELSGLSGLFNQTSTVYSLESPATMSHTQTSIPTVRKSPQYRPECSLKEFSVQDAHYQPSLPDAPPRWGDSDSPYVG